jgi:exoribonuclease II
MTLISYPRPGALCELLQGNRPLLAWIVELQQGRVRLLTVNGRESKVSVSRLLPWIGPAFAEGASRQQILQLLAEHQSMREEIAAGIDVMELWELAQGEVDKAEADWFAGLLWGSPDADHVAAVGHELLQAKTHFKFQPPQFLIHPAEKVELLLKQQETERRREELVQTGTEILHDLWSSRHNPAAAWSSCKSKAPETLAELKELLLKVVRDPSDPEAKPLFEKMSRKLPDDPFLPLLLAEIWGILPPHHNALLDRTGYVWGDGWAREHQEEILAIQRCCTARRQEPAPVSLISVDAATTRDIDDAFHVERTPGGGFRITMALACPALCFDFDSPLGQAVQHRATSLYLPEGTSHMLPEELGTEFFSLRQGHVRPSLLFDIELDGAGEPELVEPAFAWVRVERNATYLEVEDDLKRRGPDSVYSAGHELARILRERRVRKGAVILDQPDPIIRLEQKDGDLSVHIEDGPEVPRAQLLVSELMILVNSVAAAWAEERGVPLLHRTQEITMTRDISGVWSDPVSIYQAVRQLAPTTLETSPKPHVSLGAPAYSPVSSPLRRFPDLVNVAQMLSMLEEGRPRFSKQELGTLIPSLGSRLDEISQIQRYRPRYWKLLFFKQQGTRTMWPAVVVDTGGALVTLSLFAQQLLVRGPRELFGDGARLGEEYLLSLGRIRPLHNEICIHKAREKKESEENEPW